MIAPEGRERPARPRRCSRWSCSARLFRYCDKSQMAISRIEEPPDRAVSTREQQRFPSISPSRQRPTLGPNCASKIEVAQLCWRGWIGRERVHGGLVHGTSSGCQRLAFSGKQSVHVTVVHSQRTVGSPARERSLTMASA